MTRGKRERRAPPVYEPEAAPPPKQARLAAEEAQGTPPPLRTRGIQEQQDEEGMRYNLCEAAAARCEGSAARHDEACGGGCRRGQ